MGSGDPVILSNEDAVRYYATERPALPPHYIYGGTTDRLRLLERQNAVLRAEILRLRQALASIAK
jgi:hypothetical protein